jgi:DNA topoisomerase-2
MAKNVQEKYRKHELRDHIYTISDTYIGSTDSTQLKTYIYDDDKKEMVDEIIEYTPGLYKIYDEILTNAIDQVTRLKTEIQKGAKDIKPVKIIKVSIDKDTGRIEVMNDGDGIDIQQQKEYNNVWIPELIFGELLTSTNYAEGEKFLAGKNGYGAKLTNIYSKEFIVETIDHRLELSYKQRFYDNMKSRDKAVVKTSKKTPFTRVTFLPDYERFGMKKLSDSMFKLFKKRTYDATAVTDASVTVYFNDVKIDIKTFEKYTDLFLGSKTERPRAYDISDDERWEVVATYSTTHQFEQVSFASGTNTLKGGRHLEMVTTQICKKLADMALAKKKKEVKVQHIRENLFVFVKAVIVNPSFDSQSKEYLSTAPARFGSKFEVSDKFITALYKTGIMDKAIGLTDFHDQKKAAKNDGKKTARVLIPKLDDANKAGTKDSSQCTLILTEGDSAKSMAIAGLSVIGRDHYGVFPLRGKIMNVKDAVLKKIADNEEITSLKKILGLEQGKEYKDVSSLRYGKVMIMTDQDHDGSHIKGLLFNVFQSIWPSLYKQEGFLNSMLTPIIKVKHATKNDVIEFYNMTDFNTWKDKADIKHWKVKYYKGLGTSTPEEAKDYFRNMKKTIYVYSGKKSDDGIDLAFNKKRADDRKKWLMKYDRAVVLDYSKEKVPFEDFIDKELIHFSNRDLERSIPSMVDGFKESTRKIYYGCQKRKLFLKEIKVAQLSGYISEVSAYHHGETSIQQAIIGMAQNYVGSNNINILEPLGQFGTRIKGGNDAASARYIYTKLNELAKCIFNLDDSNVLHRLDDDGMLIEHEYYIPVIPMILVNGGLGIGTGFSTNIPNHNPADIIVECRKIINAIDKEGAIKNKDDVDSIYKVIDKVKVAPLLPWYLGFKGTITPDKEGTFQSHGVYKWLDDTTIEITELPIGVWTDDYKEMLVAMLQNNSPVLKDFESHYTDKSVHFVLKLFPGVRNGIESNFDTEFKLVANKNLNLNNIHLYNQDGAIQKYKDSTEIIKEWSKVRLLKYYERKKFLIKKMEAHYEMISAKVRFIKEIVENTLDVMNKKAKVLEDELKAKGYPMLSSKVEVDTGDEQGEERTERKEAVKDTADYNYLTKMPISQLTFEKKAALEKEARELEMEIKALKEKPLHAIWNEELDKLEIAWQDHKKMIEELLLANDGDKKYTGKKAAKKK